MKRFIIILTIILTTSAYSKAQYGFGTNNPDASSAFDVTATDKGFLLPRVALTGSNDQTTIASPAISLLIYNTAEVAGDHPVSPGYYYWNGTKWDPIKQTGNTTGDMQYWNGTEWLNLPAGTEGQIISMVGGVPKWITVGGLQLMPELSTTAISSVTSTSAESGGNISSDGGSAILLRGVCWNTSPNPTIANTKTEDGTGIGSFTSSITSLEAGNTYYIRAYASNNLGTSYGNQQSVSINPTIGASYQGGKLAYIFVPGDLGYVEGEFHGLVAATADAAVPTTTCWGPTTLTTGAIATAIGTGSANTTTIVAALPVGNYAAKACADYVVDIYSDWYLPSFDELYKLYVNRNSIGGFAAAKYWSSSESSTNSTRAHSVWFNTGGNNGEYKTLTTIKIRAVRTF